MTATGVLDMIGQISIFRNMFIMRFDKIFTIMVAALAAMNLTPIQAQETDEPAPVAAFDPNDPENHLMLDLSTGGRVTIVLYPHIAPNHVDRIRKLTREGFYDGLKFHRVIEGFMAQTGDPQGTGQGGSELPDLEPEFTRSVHVRGTVSMARATAPNSANSQFFIVFQPTFSLDNNYTLFGRVKSGMQYVDAIQRGEPPSTPDIIVQASIGSDNKAPPAIQATATTTNLPEGEEEVSITN